MIKFSTHKDWAPGLLSDQQILTMAQCGMITPFEATQVTTNSTISYGISSYGYDARVSTDFKIFTNTNNGIIDPKNFNPENVVHRSTDEAIIIPPNGFALAHTVEEFHIPDDVLVICLGKSTYARCFTGDTKVALVDGRALSFVELIDGVANGNRYWGYTIRADGTMGVEELRNPRKISDNEHLVAVELDDGTVIRVTADHEFMLRNGTYRQAADLQQDDNLMPLYRYNVREYEMVYCPGTEKLLGTHRLADAWNIDNGIYIQNHTIDEHRHHIDFNRKNNNPSNITRVSAEEHLRMHNEHTWKLKDRLKHGRRIVAALHKKYIDTDALAEFYQQQTKKAHDFWHATKYATIRIALCKSRTESWTQERRDMRRDEMKARWTSGVFDNVVIPVRRKDLTEQIVYESLKIQKSIKKAAEQLKCTRQLLFRRFRNSIRQAQLEGYVVTNHSVVSVTKLPEKEAVYCLEVPNSHNFALESGVFVHNCGIIVNVTPLEPGWRGQVTLEFSNTTPLPAKIYANEGACQFLFFKGSQPCEITYSLRKGKYQNQHGVTLPKVI